MKKRFKAFWEWLDWNYPIVFMIITVILLIVFIVAIVLGATNGDFNASQWVANPANPASPLY